MATQHQQSIETKPTICETHSVNLSALVKQYIASLPIPEGWRVLAIDPLNDMIVLIREVKIQ
ncbi:MAG: hypothetical protein FWH37_08770 [Candidatus Bathyarchaeota archaeon]|nr:hypothetical protein [Candidatus Termiticorpusculum sp.]